MGAYTDDVLLIHIPKCGGTACKEWMAEHMDGVKWPRSADWFRIDRGGATITELDKAQSKETLEESRLPIGHIPLRDIEYWTGRPLDSWERIVIPIRNPYVQQASQWLFWRDRYALGHNHKHDMHAASHPRLDTWVKDPESEFHRWYESEMEMHSTLRRKEGSQPYEAYGGFYPYWMAVDDKIPNNVLAIRQENLGHEFPLAMAPFIDGPPPPLHTANVGPADNHMAYYNLTSALDAVEARFKWCFANDIYNKVER